VQKARIETAEKQERSEYRQVEANIEQPQEPIKNSKQTLKMRFESKQATCKPRKNVMEESICQRTTMERVQGRKLTILQIGFRQKQIVDHQALQISSLDIKFTHPDSYPLLMCKYSTAAMRNLE
jgi:hypothetical protein